MTPGSPRPLCVMVAVAIQGTDFMAFPAPTVIELLDGKVSHRLSLKTVTRTTGRFVTRAVLRTPIPRRRFARMSHAISKVSKRRCRLRGSNCSIRRRDDLNSAQRGGYRLVEIVVRVLSCFGAMWHLTPVARGEGSSDMGRVAQGNEKRSIRFASSRPKPIVGQLSPVRATIRPLLKSLEGCTDNHSSNADGCRANCRADVHRRDDRRFQGRRAPHRPLIADHVAPQPASTRMRAELGLGTP